MKRIYLKFTSTIYLISFRRYSKASFWEIDLTNLTVLCDCSKKEAMAACKDFGAEILENVTQNETGKMERVTEIVTFSAGSFQDGKMPAAV